MYSYTFFSQGQTAQGQPFTDGGYERLNDVGGAVGSVTISGTYYFSVYSPQTGVKILKEIPLGSSNGLSINDSGTIAWTEFDADGNPSTYRYENGNLEQLNLGPGVSIQEINNSGQIFGQSLPAHENFVWKDNQFSYFSAPPRRHSPSRPTG
jgi:hypothetical protein